MVGSNRCRRWPWRWDGLPCHRGRRDDLWSRPHAAETQACALGDAAAADRNRAIKVRLGELSKAPFRCLVNNLRCVTDLLFPRCLPGIVNGAGRIVAFQAELLRDHLVELSPRPECVRAFLNSRSAEACEEGGLRNPHICRGDGRGHSAWPVRQFRNALQRGHERAMRGESGRPDGTSHILSQWWVCRSYRMVEFAGPGSPRFAVRLTLNDVKSGEQE